MLSFTASTQGNKDASQAIVMSVTFSGMFSNVQLAEGPDGQERAQTRCKPDAKPSEVVNSTFLQAKKVMSLKTPKLVVQSCTEKKRNKIKILQIAPDQQKIPHIFVHIFLFYGRLFPQSLNETTSQSGTS